MFTGIWLILEKKKLYIFHMIDILLCRKIGIKVNKRDILFYITDLLGIYFYGPKDYLQLYGRITLHVPQMKNIADNHFNL